MFDTFKSVCTRAAALLALGAMAAVPVAAAAQPVAYAHAQGPAIKGTIVSIPGKYEIQVRDRSGRIDDVSLHQGTIINPTGITLKPGFHVTVYGNPDGTAFAANEIDTPYHYHQPQVSFSEPDPFAYDPFLPYDAFGWYQPVEIVVVRHH
jgi:hypothetical protein